jgi:hypothetical protein
MTSLSSSTRQIELDLYINVLKSTGTLLLKLRMIAIRVVLLSFSLDVLIPVFDQLDISQPSLGQLKKNILK